LPKLLADQEDEDNYAAQQCTEGKQGAADPESVIGHGYILPGLAIQRWWRRPLKSPRHE
jgi:hypothetical protein